MVAGCLCIRYTFYSSKPENHTQAMTKMAQFTECTMKSNKLRAIKAAFVGFGEVNTPREIIERKCSNAREQIEAHGIEIIWANPVTDDREGRDVAKARMELANKDFDFLIVCVAGWIPSHAVIAVIDDYKHKPMLLLGLTGWQEQGRFITTADQAGTSALRKPMADLGYKFKYVVCRYGGPLPMDRILSFAKAARAASLLRGARAGMMGNRDMNLYSTLYDGMSLRSKIGVEVEFFEMLEMAQAIDTLSEDQVCDIAKEVRQRWTFTREPKPGTIEKTVRLYLAVRQKVKQRGYEAISLIDVDGVKKLMGFAPAGVFMLLHENEGVCTIPENDAMGVVTQLATRFLTGQTGAYLEFYEFLEDGMLMGVPDFVPTEVVDGPVTVMPTSFGEFGEGLLNVSKVKQGEITLARFFNTGDKYGLHITKGAGRSPRPWEEAGWTPPAPQLPSLEITIDHVENFIQNVLGQHYIVSYGDNTEPFEDLCRILEIEIV